MGLRAEQYRRRALVDGRARRRASNYRAALEKLEQAKEGFGAIGYAPLIELGDQKIAAIRKAMPAQ